FGKVTRQALSRPRLQLHTRAVADGETAKAIPLGLVLPARIMRQLGDEPRLHGLQVLRNLDVVSLRGRHGSDRKARSPDDAAARKKRSRTAPAARARAPRGRPTRERCPAPR